MESPTLVNREKECPPSRYCTAVLSGQPFQAIYVCRRCCPEGNYCLCQTCAEICHANCHVPSQETEKVETDDEDEIKEYSEAVEYIGVGPSSCDCHLVLGNTPGTTSCQCYSASQQFAQAHAGLFQWNASCTLPRPSSQKHHVRSFHINAFLNDTCMRDKIIQQAQILVQHSNDTFWLDRETVSSESLCILEDLAYQLLDFHERNDETCYLGAEWWVQVKEGGQASTIEMHYDKDEALAESFGLGVFPTYSTVTYLTNGNAPTLIFPRNYHEPTETTLGHVHVSHPVAGKHLVFDGSLLHGAIPNKPQWAVSDIDHSPSNDHDNDIGMKQSIRVTFLVNLWKDHRPMDVKVLPPLYRSKLELTKTRNSLNVVPRDKPIPIISTHNTDYQSLPFVEDGLIVKSVALPILENDDLACVSFPIGREAYIDDPYSEEDESTSSGD